MEPNSRSGIITEADAEDATVCYCYRLTVRQLKEAYDRFGSRASVGGETRGGTGCGGGRVMLHSLLGEMPSDPNAAHLGSEIGSSCFKPGQLLMKGFIIADDELESTAIASNIVAPQLGTCDSTTDYEYWVYDRNGGLVLHRTATMPTNATFTFDTRRESLPRPFHGMISFRLDRKNQGASRVNINWSNGYSTTATHELGSTGRLRNFLPFLLDERFLDGRSELFLAL